MGDTTTRNEIVYDPFRYLKDLLKPINAKPTACRLYKMIHPSLGFLLHTMSFL